MRWGFVISGLLVLVIEAFFDNVRGPLIPVFTQTLNIDYSKASLFVVWGCFLAVFFTLLLLPLMAKYPLRKISLSLCALSAIAVGFSFLVRGFLTLNFFAVIVGAVVALMGVLCNILVVEGTDLHHRSRAMCMLHMMYGFGSLVAPLVVRFFLERGINWPWVFVAILPVIILTSILLRVSLPAQEKDRVQVSLSAHLTALQWMIVVTFSIYVSGEVMTSMWMVTYLVESQSLSVAQAAPYLSGFFLVMALSRGLCFLSLRPSLEGIVLGLSLVLALFFFILGRSGHLWAFPLVGLLGPYFPLYLSRISRSFPEEAHRLTVWILSAMQLALGLFHLFVGKLTDKLGVHVAYWLPPVLFVAALGLLLLFFRAERRRVVMS